MDKSLNRLLVYHISNAAWVSKASPFGRPGRRLSSSAGRSSSFTDEAIRWSRRGSSYDDPPRRLYTRRRFASTPPPSKSGEQIAMPAFISGMKPLSAAAALRLVESGQASLFDVRSPGEFIEDHIPGSENVPVLDDDERKTVGTLHKVSSKVEARQVGAALIAKRIASHLDRRFVPSDANRLKIIYCARGGLRSQSLAMILTLIGYEARTIDGGYKSYRNLIKTELERIPPTIKFNVICGLTGTRKTETLRRLQKEIGEQVLNLEEMANHRGSVLGAMAEAQPSQRMFESRIVIALRSFDPGRPVWIEAESTKVGNLFVPRTLWESAILRPERVYELVATVEERVQYLVEEYKS